MASSLDSSTLTVATGERVGVIGLGYVGLPVALAFGRRFPGTIGFDVNADRISALARGEDSNASTGADALRESSVAFTADAEDLRGVSFFVVAVPTPIDDSKRPDLRPMLVASEIVGRALTPGGVVVYESTVYPGLTEEVCAPALAAASGLRHGADFKVGYSPERINPGDHEHTFETIVKVVSGEDRDTLERVAAAYEAIAPAGIYRATSIRVAEAAKVIENTQRDLNIALMNEVAMICDKLGISTREVLDAARTKWNFLPFSPGLVGGHCIGVDPYYLTHKAQQVGYLPQVILAGRRINDGMGAYVAQRVVKQMASAGDEHRVRGTRVGVLGLTFKEDVGDLRNSRVPDILEELRGFGVECLVHDPVADRRQAAREYGVDLVDWDTLQALDGLILAVPHRQYTQMELGEFTRPLREGGVLFDVKSALDPGALPARIEYGAL